MFYGQCNTCGERWALGAGSACTCKEEDVMTKDEALQMCLEYIETDAHERKYVRHAIKQALAAPVQEHKPFAYANPDDLSADTAFRWCEINEFTMPVYTTPPAARSCPPCNEDCDQGRNCPARKDK